MGSSGRGFTLSPGLPLLDIIDRICIVEVLNMGLFNAKARLYPDGRKIITYCNKDIFSPEFFEKNSVDIASDLVDDLNVLEKDLQSDIFIPSELRHELNVIRACIRAKQRIFDIAYLNEWSYFVTLTLDPSRYDHHDSASCKTVMQNWLRNLRTYHGFSDLRYLVVPEYGGKNKMIHFHGLFSSELPVVDSGCVIVDGYDKPIKLSRVQPGQSVLHKVFNIPIWHSGFSTAISIYKNDGALSSYFTKYMTKDVKKIFGKYYWSSHNISREPVIEYFHTNFDSHVLPSYNCLYTGGTIQLKYESLLTF